MRTRQFTRLVEGHCADTFTICKKQHNVPVLKMRRVSLQSVAQVVFILKTRRQLAAIIDTLDKALLEWEDE